MGLQRREFLTLGALGLGLGAAPVRRSNRARADLDTLAAEFAAVPRAELAQLLARRASEGLSPDEALGALFLLGLREIRPDPVGNALHSVMAVESVWRGSADLSRSETWEAVLWLGDDMRAGLELDRGGSDWSLGALEPLDLDAQAASSELRLALEGYEPERAERAALTLHARGAAGAALDVLRSFAARSLSDAGHRVVHQAQCERALARIGARHAEPVLRSLALGLAGDADGPQTGTWSRAGELAPRLGDGWSRGEEAPARSRELWHALRARSAEEAQDAIFAALQDGMGVQTVWDGMRLYAAELFWLRPDRGRIFPVHTTTELEALAWCFEHSAADVERRRLLLQAPAWLAQVRDRIVDNNGAYAAGPSLDGMAQQPGELCAALEQRSTPATLFVLEADPLALPAVLEHFGTMLVPRANQNHQFKFLAAVCEEAERTHPRWRAHVVAPAVDFLPGCDAPETDFALRARASLRAAGV